MYLLLFLSANWLTFFHMIISLIKIHPIFYLFLFLSYEGPMIETLDYRYTIRIGSTPTFLYFVK